MVFLVFFLFLISYQYYREKDYKVQFLNEKLQHYCDQVSYIYESGEVKDSSLYARFPNPREEELRITIIDFSGNVLYDNEADVHTNHATREEVKHALKYGSGYSVRRKSETIGIPFFYSAKKYGDYIIRIAIPYNTKLKHFLHVPPGFMVFSLVIFILIIIIVYMLSYRLSSNIQKLNQFVLKAETGRISENFDFPKNQLGSISENIVNLFRKLRETNNQLSDEKEKLLSHLQITNEGIAIFSADSREITTNNLFVQYVNFISKKAVGSIEDIFVLPEFKEIVSYIDDVRKKVYFVGDYEKSAIVINKNSRIFNVQCVFFRDKSFEIIINDVTATEEESRIKKDLTQNISHELKTPVSSIKGYMETIIENPDLPEERKVAYIKRSYNQSKRLVDLLNDISTLNRLDDAYEMMVRELVNISDIVNLVVKSREPEIDKHNVTVDLDIRDDVEITGNYSLIYSIFSNLVDNSLSYAGTDFKMSVKCFREDEDSYFFDVYDTGVGVPEEHLTRLFERFYRVDKGRSRKLGGTGLGLAVVKNAVIFHGGKINVKNREKGGLEFIFSLLKK